VKQAETIIAVGPPNDGRSWECQCARCGSSADYVRCDSCEDGYSHHDCGEDSCCCLDPEDNVPCDICQGRGGWNVCLSTEQWCNEHPCPGRIIVPRGSIEWFTFDAPRQAASA
jgi:hypothetical protein